MKSETLAMWLIILLIVGLTALFVFTPRPVQNPLRIYRDPATGCEYVGNGRALTPRLKPDGTQVCLGPETTVGPFIDANPKVIA